MYTAELLRDCYQSFLLHCSSICYYRLTLAATDSLATYGNVYSEKNQRRRITYYIIMILLVLDLPKSSAETNNRSPIGGPHPTVEI